jgi:ABC-type Fe3+ transport system substrate-binding protein
MRTRSGAVAMFLVLALAACQGTPPAASESEAPESEAPVESEPAESEAANAELDALVAAAQAEGELNLGWPPGGLEPDDQIEVFLETYDLDIEITYTPYPAVSDLTAEVIQVLEAGGTPPVDVMLAPSDTLHVLEQAGAVGPNDWSWSPYITSEDMVAPEGIGLVYRNDVQGITYNTELLTGDQIPTSLEDLLDPQYTGMVASTPYAAGWNYLFHDDVWGEERTLEYMEQLGPQLGGLIICPETERVASGEFPILAIDCSFGRVELAARNGLPVAMAIPEDAVTLTQWYQVVLTDAAHPNAAKLWMSWMLSRDAQDLMWEAAATDAMQVEGSKIKERLAELEAEGIVPTVVSYEWWLEGQGLEQNLSYGEVAEEILRTATGGEEGD